MNKYKYLLSISMLGLFSEVSASAAESFMPTDQESYVSPSEGHESIRSKDDYLSTRWAILDNVSQLQNRQFTRHKRVREEAQQSIEVAEDEYLSEYVGNSFSGLLAGATAVTTLRDERHYYSEWSDHQATPYGVLAQGQQSTELAEVQTITNGNN